MQHYCVAAMLLLAATTSISSSKIVVRLEGCQYGNVTGNGYSIATAFVAVVVNGVDFTLVPFLLQVVGSSAALLLLHPFAAGTC